MNNEVKGFLVGMSPAFIEWLESLRNKNPLKGSNGAENQNSVFVEIGKNLIVDRILEERKKALNPPKPSNVVRNGSDILGIVKPE